MDRSNRPAVPCFRRPWAGLPRTGLGRTRRKLAAQGLPFFAAVCLVSSPSQASEERTADYDFPAAGVRDVELHFPFGALSVEPGDDDQVHVKLELECRHHWGDCEERLERIKVEADPRGSHLYLEVMGMSKSSNHGLHVGMRVTLPKEMGLEVHMGAGELRIAGLRGDIDVRLGAGDIDIRLAEDDVGSVDLEAAVGDANLKLRHGRAESVRRHLVGGEVHWSRGEGDADVGVRVGAGDIEVRLD